MKALLKLCRTHLLRNVLAVLARFIPTLLLRNLLAILTGLVPTLFLGNLNRSMRKIQQKAQKYYKLENILELIVLVDIEYIIGWEKFQSIAASFPVERDWENGLNTKLVEILT